MEMQALQRRERMAPEAQPGATRPAGRREERLATLSTTLNMAPPVQRLAALAPRPGIAVIQLTKVPTESGEKEIADLSTAEMNILLNEQPRALAGTMEQEILDWIEAKAVGSFARGYKRRLEEWKTRDPLASPKKEKVKSTEPREKVVARTYEDSDSELSEAETDPDRWARRKPFGTTSALNRSHVPSAKDRKQKEGTHITGLHHADTFMIVKQGGQFIPRTINGRPNNEAHRKPLPEDQLRKLQAVRDDPEASEEAREKAAEELVAAQKQLLFGNAIDWEEGEYDKQLVADQERHREELGAEETPAGRLIRRGATGGVRSGKKEVTHTDAEQRLLSSKLWKSMLMNLMELIDAVGTDPVLHGYVAERGIQLMLNRSSCLGCGKALTLALVDFWKAVAQVVGFKDWREARAHFASATLFRISFPVIYEYEKESKRTFNFANFKAILAGLHDAGWTVDAPKGVESNAHAEKNHQALKTLLEQARPKESQAHSHQMEEEEDPIEQVEAHFRIGHASGENNQCLLSTVYQLSHDTEDEDEEAIGAMRETLHAHNLAGLDDMIDIYGGAGMQLANDLGIRIQVIQIAGSRIISHPILGSGGPLCFILHQGAHFSPLWRE